MHTVCTVYSVCATVESSDIEEQKLLTLGLNYSTVHVSYARNRDENDPLSICTLSFIKNLMYYNELLNS